jgi:hypothetical protein
MEKVQTNISTIPVTIKVIEVGNKKMTISVFNQIPLSDFFYSIHKDTFLGWVSYKNEQFVLFTKDGILLKDLVYEIPNMVKYNYQNRGRMDSEDYEYINAVEKYEKAKKRIEITYQDLLDNKNQIYIAV